VRVHQASPPVAEAVEPLDAGTERAVLPITIRTATGRGRTLLSAFDSALFLAGVADFNLIRLSSVIPQQAEITRTSERLPGGHGDRLYCVYASAFAEQPGDTAWAGIGWVRDEVGNGLFVEHHAGSEETLLELIHLSLEDMNARRGGQYGPVEYATASAHHDQVGSPSCALVIAAYQTQDWGVS
jgi:arginine decarboxylase